jgi:organic radical activating enzyme
MNRKINSITFGITTKCNRLCPDCICGMTSPNIIKRDTSADWIKQIAKKMQGLNDLVISGGEPLMHKDFSYIAKNSRAWFKPKKLTLFTNGYMVMHFADLIKNVFDEMHITRYDENTYPNSKSNVHIVSEVCRNFKDAKITVVVEKPAFKKPTKNNLPCRMSINDRVFIQDMFMYPCCAAPGNAPYLGIMITDNWKQDIIKVSLPCDGCIFSTTTKEYNLWMKT